MSAKWIVYAKGMYGDIRCEFTRKEDAEAMCDRLEACGYEPVVELFAW